jgi:hypothetical protein
MDSLPLASLRNVLGPSQAPPSPGERDFAGTSGRRTGCCVNSPSPSWHWCACQEQTFWNSHFVEAEVHRLLQYPQPGPGLHILLIWGKAPAVPNQDVSIGDCDSICQSHSTASYLVLNSDKRNSSCIDPIPILSIFTYHY